MSEETGSQETLARHAAARIEDHTSQACLIETVGPSRKAHGQAATEMLGAVWALGR